jgi:hypothetical protein
MSVETLIMVWFLWVMTQCSPVGGYQRFRGTYRLHLQHSGNCAPFETSVTTHKTTQCQNPEHHDSHNDATFSSIRRQNAFRWPMLGRRVQGGPDCCTNVSGGCATPDPVFRLPEAELCLCLWLERPVVTCCSAYLFFLLVRLSIEVWEEIEEDNYVADEEDCQAFGQLAVVRQKTQ